MNELFFENDVDTKSYSKFLLDNSDEYLKNSNDDIYTLFPEGKKIISCPVSERINSYNIDRFTPNFSNNWAKVYTLFILNKYIGEKRFFNAIIPFMKYQFKLNEKQEEILYSQFHNFKKVLKISKMEKLSFNPPFEIEKNDDFTYYSNDDLKKIQMNLKYIKHFNSNCQLIMEVAKKYKISQLKLNKNQYVDYLEDINTILQKLISKLNSIYIIYETRKILLNTRKLFYIDNQYNKLSIDEYNQENISIKKQLKEQLFKIEDKYLKKGIAKLRKIENIKKINYGITWLQNEKITISKISKITGLSRNTISKYLPDIWKEDLKSIF